MRKIFFLAFSILSLFFLDSCREQKNIKLLMAEPNNANSLSSWVDQQFIAKVYDLSGGTIEIELSSGGIFGDNEDVISMMTKPGSKIHISRSAPATFAERGCDKHELLSIPFTFKSHDHFWKFATSPIAEKILNEPYEKKIGVKGLFFTEEGFRHFFSSKPLNGLEDFAGEKVRTGATDILESFAKALNAQIVTASYINLYSSLQTGAVNIAEQPMVNYLSNHFNKVAPYMILDGHELGVSEYVITTEIWEKLSKHQQGILLEAGKYAGEYCKKIIQESENDAKITLLNEGVTFTEVKDISKWQEACADVISKAVRNNTVLYGEIINLAD